MVKTWTEVEASPEYQALGLGEKKQARDEYFVDVVAPQVPEQYREEAWNQFYDDTAAELPEESVLDAADKAFENTPELVGSSAIGLLEAGVVRAGDPKNILNRAQRIGEDAKDLADTGFLENLGAKFRNTVAATTLPAHALATMLPSYLARTFTGDDDAGLQEMREDLMKGVEENTPVMDSKWSPAGLTYNFTTSLAQNALPTVAGLAMRSPNVALMPMAALSAGSTAAEQLDAGRDPYQATAAGIGAGAAEWIGEKIPFDILAKEGTPFIRRMLGAALGDAGGEMATQTFQSGIDQATIKPGMTWEEAIEDIGYAGLLGAVSGPVLSVPAHGLDLASRRRAEKNKPPPPPEPPAPPGAPPAGGALAPAASSPSLPAPSGTEYSVDDLLPEEFKELARGMDAESQKAMQESAQNVTDEELDALINSDMPVEQILQVYSEPARPPAAPELPAVLPTAPAPVMEAEPAATVPAESVPETAFANIPQGDGTRLAPIKAVSDDDVLLAGAQAASSPFNDHTEPTDGQKKAGNYKKGHLKIHGLDVAIETPRAGKRAGKDADGKPWEVQLQHDYGYIKRTEGADGDHVDTFLGPEPESQRVFVIDQVDPETGKFDEHKVMMGFPDEKQAMDAYRSAFSDGKADLRMGGLADYSVDDFKTWLKEGNTRKPATKLPWVTERLSFSSTAPETQQSGGAFAEIDTKLKGMPATQLARRKASLERKVAAGITPTTAEMYEREKLSAMLGSPKTPAGEEVIQDAQVDHGQEVGRRQTGLLTQEGGASAPPSFDNDTNVVTNPQAPVNIPAREEIGQNKPELAKISPSGNADTPSGNISVRKVRDDEALTPRMQKVGVQYALAEADDLVPSQTDDMTVNPRFPQELQPRDRTRASSEMQIQAIAQKLEPRLLLESPQVSEGAPIIAADGVVESGNGRVLALRRAYKDHPESAAAYRAALQEAGYPVDGMKNPVLVRVRTQEMTPAERAQFTKEANERTTSSMSSTETAFSDARTMPDSILELYREGDVLQARNREFVRAFVREVIPKSEQASAITKDGTMSSDLVRRINAAMLAKAYGDETLVQTIVESPDRDLKSLGDGMVEAAATWSKMRAMAKDGQLGDGVDDTQHLVEAVKLILEARTSGAKLTDLLGQQEMFTSGTHPMSEMWARLFHHNEALTRLRSKERIAGIINYYAGQAMESKPGVDMLGEKAPGANQLLKTTKDKVIGDEPGKDEQESLFAAGGRPAGENGGNEREVAPANEGQAAAPANSSGVSEENGEVAPDTNVGRKKPGDYAPEADALFQAAFHGSPYNFDKFTLDRIGTGEGAQAYGWGLYFASKREVAELYREKLSQGNYPELDELRAYFKPGNLVEGYAGKDRVVSFEDSETSPDKFPDQNGGWDWRATVQRVVQKNGEWVDAQGEKPRTHHTAPTDKEIDKLLGAKKRGQLYQVEIPEDNVMLDWDKPLSEQSEEVKAALTEGSDTKAAANMSKVMGQDVYVHHGIYFKMTDTGRDLYEQVASKLGKEDGQKLASSWLNSLGIKGIKYLDGTSRRKGDGTHNYVIFDDNAISVLDTFYLQPDSRQAAIDTSGFQAGTGHLYKPKEAWTKKDIQMAAKLKKLAQEKFGEGFDVRFYDAMTDMDGKPVHGSYVTERDKNGNVRARFAAIVLEAGNPNKPWSLHHEGIHFLRRIGAFGDTWATLRHQANTRWIKEHNIRERYEADFRQLTTRTGEKLTDAEVQELLVEEAVAEAFAQYENRGAMRKIWDKIRDFLTAWQRQLHDEGFKRWQDIFEDVGSGRMREAGGRKVWQDDELIDEVFLRPQILKAVAKTAAAAKGTKEFAMKFIGDPATMTADFFRLTTRTNDHMLSVLSKRYGSKAIQTIRKRLYATPGQSDEAITAGLDEATRRHTAALLNRVGLALEKLTPAENARVTQLIQDPKLKTANKKLADAAVEITKLLTEHRQYLRDKGIKIHDVQGYFPRIYDAAKAAKDPRGFLKAAEDVYYVTYRADLEKEILDAMAKRGQGPTTISPANMERLVRSKCKVYAQEWLHNMQLRDMDINPGDKTLFGGTGGMPVPNSLKSRSLSKEADDIMRAYLVQDPFEAITGMVIRTTRRAEFESRFGPKEWGKLRQEMIDEGVDQDGIDLVKLIIRSSTYNMGGASKTMREAGYFFRSVNFLAHLARVLHSSIPEPALNGVRTGRARDGLVAFYDTMRVTKKRLMRSGTPKDLEEYKNIGEYVLGMFGEHAEMLEMQYRIGQFDSVPKGSKTVQQKFFRAVALAQYTEYSRIATIKQGVKFIQRMCEEATNPKARYQKSAKWELRQLGIDDARMPGFAKYVAGGGLEFDQLMKVNSVGQLRADEELAATALRRFAEQVILEPKAAERQTYAQHPLGNLVYSLQAYLMSFSKNVLMREFYKTKEAFARGKNYSVTDRLHLMPNLLAHALVIALTAAVTELRDELLYPKPDRKDKPLSKFDYTMRIVSRGGYFGGLDPWMNFMRSLKYGHTPSDQILGPAINSALEPVTATLNLVSDRNSPKTNTAERRAMIAYWKYGVVPAANALAASKLPVWAAYPTIQVVSSPQLQEAFVSSTAGKKQER